MGEGNQTSWTYVYLVGFSDVPHLGVPIFLIFLLTYLAIVAGNLPVISVICADSHLHTPMYFFITNLSCIDICYSSLTFPKILANFFVQTLCMPLQECFVQFYFFMVFNAAEFVLLIGMSFDRYAAICNPLRYSVIMSKSVCVCLAAAAYICGFIAAIPHFVLFSQLTFCKASELNHFFCDVVALLSLSCTSTHTIDVMSYVMSVMIPVVSFTLIITSYVRILSAILKIQSKAGRNKAFSTCASHLTVVILFCGVLLFTYMRPTSAYSPRQSKISSFFNFALSPLCNPIIYTFNNKEFKSAVKRIQKRYWLKQELNNTT